MNVLYICSSIHLPHRAGGGMGGSTHALEVARHLAESGSRCVIACAQAVSQAPFEEVNGIPTHRLFRVSPLRKALKRIGLIWTIVRAPFFFLASCGWAASLLAIARATSADVIYERTYGPNLAGTLTAILSGRPYFLELNDENCNRVAQALATGIITPSKQVLPRGLHRKVYELPWGVNTTLFNPQPPCHSLREKYSLSGKRVVVFVASGLAWHGLTQIVEAWPLISQSCPAAHLLVVGGSEMANAEAQRELVQKAAHSSVTFTGYVPYEQVPGLIQLAELGLAPYTSQLASNGRHLYASPMKVVEYFACAKPVIVSEAGNAKGIVEPGRSGLVIPDDSPAHLASATLQLLNDPERTRVMGRYALAVARRKYSWTSHCQQLKDLFAASINARKHKPNAAHPDSA